MSAEPMKVLAVDDDADTLVYMSTFLEDNGYEVHTADDSRAALAVLEDYDPDVIILDVLMPGRSGLDLLVKLRKAPRWCDKRLILLTGNDKVVQNGGRNYLAGHGDIRGADAVLSKPLDKQALLDALEG